MDALDLRYEDGSFDGVFSSSSIEHFGTPADVHRALAEIHRVLKPGGVLSLSTEFRLGGPGPGLPGILMFDAAEVAQIFLEPFDWEPLDPVVLEVSEATLRTEQSLVDLSAEVAAHVEEHGFIEFHRLDWARYPHIVLRHEAYTWTSMHLALRKPEGPAGPDRRARPWRRIRR
jgi:SAM-dependent methyltransferase